MKLNLVIAGVGGQGNIFASEVIAQYAMKKGYNVFGTETIGAAQRGGSVVSHVRIADGPIYSPLVPQGQADYLVGFEPMEALRYINLTKPGATFLINRSQVPTISINMGLDRYPEEGEIIKTLSEAASCGYAIDATKAAAQMGNTIYTNVILLGALSKICPELEPEGILEAILGRLKPKTHEANRRAFALGQELVSAPEAKVL